MLDPHKLTKHPVENIKRGIYFLFKDDELVYVGKSENILGRIGTHTKEKQGLFDHYAYFVTDGDIGRLEAEYIHKYDPILNVGHDWLNCSMYITFAMLKRYFKSLDRRDMSTRLKSKIRKLGIQEHTYRSTIYYLRKDINKAFGLSL